MIHRHIPAIKNRAENAAQTGGVVIVDAATLLELIRDAKRYQYIRACLHRPETSLIVTDRKTVPDSCGVYSTEILDSIIDAALTHSAELKCQEIGPDDYCDDCRLYHKGGCAPSARVKL